MTKSVIYNPVLRPINKTAGLVISSGTHFVPKLQPNATTQDLPYKISKDPIFSKPEHNLTGKVYGRLSVIGLYEEPGRKKKARYVCKCVCGRYELRLGNKLRAGMTNDYLMCEECQITERLRKRASRI